METVLIIGASLLMLTGIIGSVAPILPGPPLSYIGLLMLQLLASPPFTTRFLVVMGIITAVVTALDYLIPIYGAKRFGGSGYGVWGSAIGLIIGLIFPPFGLIIGPFAGAVAGELAAGKEFQPALKAGLGSFIGFLAGSLMKLLLCLFMAYFFVTALL